MARPRIDFYASEPHYAAHMRPVWEGLPDRLRGTLGIAKTPANAVVVASYGDYRRVVNIGYTHIALMQHGAGQSYGNSTHYSYPGGVGQGKVSLFLCPNEYSASRWRLTYPNSAVQVVGSPATEHLPARESGLDKPVVAVSFHWKCSLWPETMPAFAEFRQAILSIPNLIGHGHPRAWHWLAPWYKRHHVPIVQEWADVCRQADVYVCDNSSTLFEFAATGRPVVLLNSRHYRKHVNHGGRFWDWSTVGLQVDSPSDLAATVKLAALDPPGLRQERERVVGQVYSRVAGSTLATVLALMEWA